MISITVLALLIGIASSIYVNFFGSIRNLKAANTVYEEARFLMERIVKEVRNGTIDYEEYYNQNVSETSDSATVTNYALNYCQYSRQFYDPGPDGFIGTYDDKSVGERFDILNPPAIGNTDGTSNPIQNSLFLINIEGDEKTYVRRVIENDGDYEVGKVGLLRLEGKDFGIDNLNAEDPDLDGEGGNCATDSGENDGKIDTWLCAEGFNCPLKTRTSTDCTGYIHDIKYTEEDADNTSFITISPPSLDVVSLKFIVSPMDDPRKAYNDNSVQVQPHVTVRLVVRANPRIASEFKTGNSPDIILESTVSTRIYNPIITECNLTQCTGLEAPGSGTIDCPYTAGVCGKDADSGDGITWPAQQSCTNFIWSGCNEDTYKTYAEDEWGDADLYQHGSEFASCESITNEGDKIACKEAYCSDEYDNDCDGFEDGDDTDCKNLLCTNGTYDGVEEELNCIDVGGICSHLKPFESEGEESCFDGYDNDCDGYADEFDVDCLLIIGSNGIQNAGFLNYLTFVDENLGDTGYIKDFDNVADYDPNLDEDAVDIGGICEVFVDEDGIITGYDPDDPPSEGERLFPDASFGDNEVGNMCYDGLDNDDDGYADEFDDDCIPVICNNGVQDCSIAPPGYLPQDYLVGYTGAEESPICSPFNDNDEKCIDVGGICDDWRDIITVDTLPFYVDHKKIAGEADGVDHPAPDPDTTPYYTCRDGLDNDCNGFIDWEDESCCYDADGDDVIGLSETCDPPDWVVIDCDDTDPNTYPGAPEICDGIANNDCDEYISDYSDPDCCVDTDGDYFGVADAYLSCAGTEPDCDDTDPNIYPGAPEETAEQCSNEYADNTPKDDNCNGRANHIDWYHNHGGIADAYANSLFEPSCCNLTAIEICDDMTHITYGSDENCNGLEGNADHQCVTANGLSFKDNFTSNTFIYTTTPGIVHNTSLGTITLENGTFVGEVIASKNITPLDPSSCAGNFRITIIRDTSTPSGTGIEYQLSSDGATWCSDTTCDGLDWISASDGHAVIFDSSSHNVFWRASLEGDGGSNVPTLNSITINLECL